MQRKFTLMGGAAFGAMLVLGFAASADAKVVKHHHHVAAAPADDKVAALSSEVETLETRLESETLAREQLQTQVQAAQNQAAAAQADADAAHQQLQAQIQTIPGEVSSAIAANKPKPTWADNTKVGATVFTDLSNINQVPTSAAHPSVKNGTGFDVKRAYLSVDHSFNSIYSANLTVDFAPQDASTTFGGSAVNQGEEVIKYAYVQAKYADELVLQAGAQKTPWIPFVEEIYNYRYIDKVVIDQNKFGNSSDWGVNAHGDVGHGLFDYSISASDGQGYKTPDRSDGMDFEGRANVNWMGFTAALGGYTGKLGQDFNGVTVATRTATREDALIAYVSPQIHAGFEYFQSNNALTGGTQVLASHAPDKAQGYSAFGSFNFTPQWAVFGRYDWANPSQDVAPSERYDYYNIGISYEPVKIVDLALVYKHEAITHAPTGGYTDATTTLAPQGGNGHFDEVGLFTQFKF